MSKFKIFIVFLGFFIFTYCPVGPLALAASEEGQSPAEEVASPAGDGWQGKYNALLRDYEAVKADRDNILAQTKNLLQQKARTKEVEEVLEKMQIENQLAQAEKERAVNKTHRLEEEIKELRAARAQMDEETQRLKAIYEQSEKKDELDQMQEEIRALQADREDIKKLLAAEKKESSKMEREARGVIRDKEKLEDQIEELHAEVKQFKDDYNEAVKKNRGLEKQIREIPGKFSEVARQNKKLIKDAAKMHYNLGVFYTKNQEYSRALAEFSKAVELSPNDAYSHFNLGYIYAEHLVNRKKAIENFRHFLRLAKSDDKDVDWVKKYLLTWETYEGKAIME